jgi:CRISPR-associated protein Csb1
MSDEGIVKQYDEWLDDSSAVAALVMRQWLVPVEGKDAVIFPPTYATPERSKEEDWLGYNIDRFSDGTSVCQIDSVGAQANRLEPTFLRARYSQLVPQVTIKAGDKEVNLLQAGHRAADAVVRFSSLAGDLDKAFRAFLAKGNAEPLAKIAPTSLVFGAWDSRATQAKLPRILRSVIRAFNVETLHRSAQYNPPVDYVADGLLDAPESKKEKDSRSELGLRHAPAPWTHGGIQVRGEIRRDVTLNLAALRAIGAGPDNPGGTMKLRRYILGLALIGFTAPQETFLREGCQLVPDKDNPSEWNLVKHDGQGESFQLTHAEALAFAEEAAREFEVGEDRTGVFDTKLARQDLDQTKDERKAGRRRGQLAAQPEPAVEK